LKRLSVAIVTVAAHAQTEEGLALRVANPCALRLCTGRCSQGRGRGASRGRRRPLRTRTAAWCSRDRSPRPRRRGCRGGRAETSSPDRQSRCRQSRCRRLRRRGDASHYRSSEVVALVKSPAPPTPPKRRSVRPTLRLHTYPPQPLHPAQQLPTATMHGIVSIQAGQWGNQIGVKFWEWQSGRMTS